MKKMIAMTIAMTCLAMTGAHAQTSPEHGTPAGTESTENYTFPLAEHVTRQRVTFKNRYGINLTGDLYVPNDQAGGKLKAIVISGPYGAVKEQVAGLYANQMAQRGFVALAFDPSFTGESGGEPRDMASPEINTEDVSAAVDHLGMLPFVDREKIGAIGICGGGGFALSAVQGDKRIKAIATLSKGTIGMFDQGTAEQRSKTFEQLGQQRWKDAEAGSQSRGPQIVPAPDDLVGSEPDFVKDYADYYRTPRGFHPRSPNSTGAWTATNSLPFMNLPMLTHLKEISPRPILLIAGDKAFSLPFSKEIYEAAAEPKELLLIPGAVHTDLYDKVDVIPFEKLNEFFEKHLS